MRISVRTTPPVVQVEGASDVVLGKYDVLDWACVAQATGAGEISISAERPAAKKDSAGKGDEQAKDSARKESVEPSTMFAVRVRVHVTHDRKKAAGLLALAVVGLATYTATAPFWWLASLVQWLASLANINAAVRSGLDWLWPLLRWAGLAIAMGAGGNFLERLLKLRGEVTKSFMASSKSDT